MRLNILKPAQGSNKKRKRIGRGIGSGSGKTCGRGHKGQKSRSGGLQKTGFEGGQMPLQRRLPKVGFSSHKSKITAEVALSEIAKIDADIINMNMLYKANILPRTIKRARIILSGKINKAVTFKGIYITRGVRQAIERVNGKIKVGKVK